MSVSNFAWFASYTEVLDSLPTDEQKLAFALGVAHYGTFGEEPDFEDAILKVAFSGIRPNIDNSRKKAAWGKKGGEKKARNERERREKAAREYEQPKAASMPGSMLGSEWIGKDLDKDPDAGSVSYQNSSGEPIAFPVVSFG